MHLDARNEKCQTRLEKKERNSCHVHTTKIPLSVSFVYLEKPYFLDSPTTLQPFKDLSDP